MVRDQQLKSTDYLALIAAQVAQRAQPRADRDHPRATRRPRSPASSRTSGASARRTRFFELAWDALQAAPQGDLQIIWGRTLIGIAITPEDIRQFAPPRGRRGQPSPASPSTRRCAGSSRPATSPTASKAPRRASTPSASATPRTAASALCSAARSRSPTRRVKAEAWRRFHDEGYGSLHLTSAAMSGFQWYVQRDLTRPYDERFFEAAPGRSSRRARTRPPRAYFGGLFPGRVDQEVLDRSERLPRLDR